MQIILFFYADELYVKLTSYFQNAQPVLEFYPQPFFCFLTDNFQYVQMWKTTSPVTPLHCTTVYSLVLSKSSPSLRQRLPLWLFFLVPFFWSSMCAPWVNKPSLPHLPCSSAVNVSVSGMLVKQQWFNKNAIQQVQTYKKDKNVHKAELPVCYWVISSNNLENSPTKCEWQLGVSIILIVFNVL